MNEAPFRSTDVTGDVQNVWYHIPTPGDHYSPRTGSAVITIVHQLCRLHTGESRVIVQQGTMDGYDIGRRVEVNYRRLGTPPSWAKVIDRSLGILTDKRPLTARRYFAAARAIGKDFSGFVFVHNEPSAVECIAEFCPRAKVVLWVHNELFRTYRNNQIKRVVRKASLVVCVSEFIRSDIVRCTGEDEKIKALLNGVDTSKFAPLPGKQTLAVPVVLFVGRMIPQKGPHLLLKAASILEQRNVACRLRLVGSAGFANTPTLSAYEQDLKKLTDGLANAVSFSGFVDRTGIVSEYQHADIFCAPSTWDDPCPLTVLEAMATGLPCVGTNRGGIPEEIGGAGIVVEPTDVAIADAIEQLVTSREQRAEYGLAARRRAEQLSWTNCYANLASYLKAV